MFRIFAIALALSATQASAVENYRDCISQQIEIFQLRDLIAVKSQNFGIGFRRTDTGSNSENARAADAAYKEMKEAAEDLAKSHAEFCKEFDTD